MSRLLNIGHRGASGSYPENTLAAFRAAVESGADMCELDVHLTRDGALVVIHDDDLDRTTTGRGPVGAYTLAELQSFDAGIKFSANLAGERIPTLEQVFELVRGRCGLNVELKGNGTESAVRDMIRRFNVTETTIVSSFDWKMLRATRELDKQIKIGILAEKRPDRMLQEAVNLDAFAIHPRHDLVTTDLCERAHSLGLQVYVWTVDDPGQIRALVKLGVDGIMTNYPERLRTAAL